MSSLNLLSKYAPQPAASAPSPGLPITQPILQDVVSSIPVAVKNVLPEVVVKKDLVPLVSFERSGDREERQPGDDKFEVEGIKVPERPLKPGEEGEHTHISIQLGLFCVVGGRGGNPRSFGELELTDPPTTLPPSSSSLSPPLSSTSPS